MTTSQGFVTRLPSAGNPLPDQNTLSCRGDPLAVPRELRPVDRSLVSAQGVKQLPAASGIDADLAILTGGENALAIARELNTEDRSLMPRQRIHKFVLAQTDHYRIGRAAGFDLRQQHPMSVGGNGVEVGLVGEIGNRDAGSPSAVGTP